MYQKSLANKTISHGSNSYDVSDLSIETLVSCFINTSQYNGTFNKRFFPDDEHEIYMTDSNYLKVESAPSYSFTGCTISIQYTKTTD